MKKLLAIAALLLASTAAQAQYTFEYGGKTIRVDPDRGTVQIPGVYDNTKKAKRAKDERPSGQANAAGQDRSAGAACARRSAGRRASSRGRRSCRPPLRASVRYLRLRPSLRPATAAVAPADTATAPPPSSAAVQQTAPAAPPAPAAHRPCARLQRRPLLRFRRRLRRLPGQPRRSQASNSPLGVWLTEEKEGKVRIEQCGGNLCGYAVDKKSNQNGEQVLINMKPGKDKWSGRILDPNSGSTYDSTIAMKGTDTLRVQGCAFGGMFCGGQTWTRVN